MRLPSSLPRRQREPYGPLVDVVFLLLVFFLLAGTLEPLRPLEVNPPESEQADLADSGALKILLDAEGRIAVAGEVLEVEALATVLGEREDRETPRSVQVEADGMAAAGAVLALLEQLRALGFARLELVTRPQSIAPHGRD